MLTKGKMALTSFLLSLANLLSAEITFSHRTDTFATHQPVLYEIVKNTTGPIIEFGCGDSSTDLLHEMCKKDQRLLISIDDDRKWLKKYQMKYKGEDWHKFYYVPGKRADRPNSFYYWVRFLDNFKLLKTTNFDLCFIDQSPWMARYETLKRLKDKSRYVIVHDCDYFAVNHIFGKIIKPSSENTPGIIDYSDVFRYFKVYYPLNPWPLFSGPPTLLGSDTESDLPEIDYTQY